MENLVLVKNLLATHREEFKQDGTVQVGSFSLYRPMEGHAGDEDEGNKGFKFTSDKPVTTEGKIVNTLMPRIYIGGSATYKGLTRVVNVPDAYIFCVSSKIDTNLGNSHYKITNCHKFGMVLFDTLRSIDSQVFGWKLGKVEYGGLKDPIHTLDELYSLIGVDFNQATLDDYFRKSSKYACDDEYRFVFFTSIWPIPKSIRINNIALTSFCTFD
jgi:hypothetical protein